MGSLFRRSASRRRACGVVCCCAGGGAAPCVKARLPPSRNNPLETSRSRRLIFIPLSPIVGSSVAENEHPTQRGVEVVRYVSVNQRRILAARVPPLPQLVIPRRETSELKWISS